MSVEKQIEEIGTKVLIILHAFSSVLKLYESNNQAVVRQLNALESELQKFFATGAPALRLTLRSEEFFINDRLLKVDLQLYTRAKELAEQLSVFEWNDLKFSNPTSRADLEQFVDGYSSSIRSSTNQMSAQGYGGITGTKAVGSSAAAFRFEPSKLAIWTYAGLIDVVESLYNSHRLGETPSLLPVRRSLQMVIDNMQEHSGIYQMLSSFRDSKRPRSPANQHVAMAIDAIGFGQFLGMPPIEVLNLALASVLSGLSDPDATAIETVAPLYSFTGLGELALRLVLLLHDSRQARAGSSVGVPGNVLMIVEEYHRRIDAAPDEPLPAVIYSMHTESAEYLQPVLVQIYARYKGPFPIGSLIKVDKQLLVVIGHGANAMGKQRPIVAEIHQNQVQRTRDLSKESSAHISAVSSQSQAKLLLSELSF